MSSQRRARTIGSSHAHTHTRTPKGTGETVQKWSWRLQSKDLAAATGILHVPTKTTVALLAADILRTLILYSVVAVVVVIVVQRSSGFNVFNDQV
jgi:hypothetical protein